MPDYTLKVEGPRPTTQHISANDENGAMMLAKDTIEADYGDEGDPAILQSNVTLTSADETYYDGTVAQVLERKA